MKLVRLTVTVLIAAFFVVVPQGVCGQGAETCNPYGKKPCSRSCGEHCSHGGLHGKHFSHDGHDASQDCMIGRYGYGKAPICEQAKAGEVCPVHGYGPCPKEQVDFGLGLRQAMTPADRPYFGMQPLLQPRPLFSYGRYGYGPHGYAPHGYGPLGNGQHGGVNPSPPRFPVLHSFFVQPPIYMTTSPQPPMPTYTTRGPRDFLNPNPPSIGY